MDGDRVRMLQDGVGSGDVSDTSHDHGVTIDPLSVERIEVIRGPATLLYGSSAIGGVVNVEDGRIPTFRLGERFGGAVEIGGGTVADDRNAAASLEGGGEVWAWHLGGYYRDADDYEIPGASAVDGAGEEGEEPAFDVLPNSDLQNGGGTVGFSRFFGDDGFAGLSYSRFDSEYGIPSEAAEGVRIEMERDRFDFRTEVMNEFGPFSGFRLRAGATDYEHTEFEGPEIGTVFLNDYWEGRAEVVQQERGRLSGAIGVQASDRKLEAVGEEAFIPSTDAEDLALFVFEELGWDAVKLQLGARYDTRDVTAHAPDLPARDFDDVSASLGLRVPAHRRILDRGVARSRRQVPLERGALFQRASRRHRLLRDRRPQPRPRGEPRPRCLLPPRHRTGHGRDHGVRSGLRPIHLSALHRRRG